ncbi:MAG: glycosyltransferase [Rikenellaceae bacterium]
MKILHIGQMVGGISVYIKNTTTLLSGDIEFVIASGRADNNKPVEVNGVTIREYKIDLYRELSLKDFKALWQAVQIIRRERPSVVHCHSAKGGFIGRIAGFVCGVPTLYTPHAYSFLSTDNSAKRMIFLFLEKFTRLNSYMLACSDSERELGRDRVGYKETKALLWNNSVPDVQA